jgi:hypothetical protein
MWRPRVRRPAPRLDPSANRRWPAIAWRSPQSNANGTLTSSVPFPAESAAFRLVSEWVDGERLCCPFFDIDLRFEREHGALWLSLRGREGVKQFIHADFAKWFQK